MERLVRWLGAFGMSALFNAGVLIVVFGLGAPPWILIPVNIAGMTLYAEMSSRFRQRSDPR